jgi:hypothetical protein
MVDPTSPVPASLSLVLSQEPAPTLPLLSLQVPLSSALSPPLSALSPTLPSLPVSCLHSVPVIRAARDRN